MALVVTEFRLSAGVGAILLGVTTRSHGRLPDVALTPDDARMLAAQLTSHARSAEACVDRLREAGKRHKKAPSRRAENGTDHGPILDGAVCGVERNEEGDFR